MGLLAGEEEDAAYIGFDFSTQQVALPWQLLIVIYLFIHLIANRMTSH